MSLTDPTRGDSLILSETMRRISLRPYHFRQLMQNTKSSLLTKLTTQPTMYSSSYGLILRHFITTADSSLPATIRIKSSNHSIQGVLWLSSVSKEKKKLSWQDYSLSVSKTSWIRKASSMIQKSLQNLLTNISPTGGEF